MLECLENSTCLTILKPKISVDAMLPRIRLGGLALGPSGASGYNL